MARGTNQKLKLYYLVQIMLAKTDEEHSLTMPQIIQELGKYDITAERKSIYLDFDDMTDKLGIEIVKEQKGRETYYHVASREFELAEVKLLIDAIQSSKFITEKKSSALIRKIKKFVSEYQAKQLQRQVFVQGRIKTMNETIYYGVDDIHRAISENRKIRFKYYQWNIKKELVPRHNGDWITVSPWALTWDDENYYLIGYDSDAEQIRHYRVDKMLHIQMLKEKKLLTSLIWQLMQRLTSECIREVKKRYRSSFRTACAAYLSTALAKTLSFIQQMRNTAYSVWM